MVFIRWIRIYSVASASQASSTSMLFEFVRNYDLFYGINTENKMMLTLFKIKKCFEVNSTQTVRSIFIHVILLTKIYVRAFGYQTHRQGKLANYIQICDLTTNNVHSNCCCISYLLPCHDAFHYVQRY